MKNRILVMAFCLLSGAAVMAQTFQFGDTHIEYKEDTIDAVRVKLDPPPKTIKDQLEDWMNDNYDVNLDGKTLLFFEKEYMTAKGVHVPKISDKKIDLYVKTDETNDEHTVLYVFSSFGYNSWIENHSNPKEFKSMKKIVDQFVSGYLPEYYNNRIEETRDELEDLTDDKEDLQESIADNNEEISELKKDNEELEKELKELNDKIKKQESQLGQQKKEYQNIKKKVKK